MTTLHELMIRYKKSPKTGAAVARAIKQYGENAEAVVTSGLPSCNVRSNISRAAKRANFKKFYFFCGGMAGKYYNDGYITIVVKVE